MEQFIKEVIPMVVQLVFLLVTTFLIPTIKKWLNEKLNEKQLATLEMVTKHAVYAVEQMIKEANKGEIKKEQVISFVKEYCEEHKIELNENLLDILIESIVKEMNDKK